MLPRRLLCAGRDLERLHTRRAVLSLSGYDAQAATLSQAESLLRGEHFDLVIISAWLTEWERYRILSKVGKTPTFVLDGLILAEELLAGVAEVLEQPTLPANATTMQAGPKLQGNGDIGLSNT